MTLSPIIMGPREVVGKPHSSAAAGKLIVLADLKKNCQCEGLITLPCVLNFLPKARPLAHHKKKHRFP